MTSNTTLTFSPPQKLSEHFIIPFDDSKWTGKVGEYSTCFDNQGKKIGLTPARDRAAFQSLTRSLTPITHTGKSLDLLYGVYLLAFDVPSPAFYLGIAASSGRAPEGMLSRIRKHRVKLTCSHIGTSPTTHGGVNHTGGWREFAAKRARHFSQQALPDGIDDGRFSCGHFQASGGRESHKVEAEWFESTITSGGAILTSILRLLWPSVRSQDAFLLTTGNCRGVRPLLPQISLWDGTEMSL